MQSGNKADAVPTIIYKDVDFIVENGEIVVRDAVKMTRGGVLFLALEAGMRLRPTFDELGRRSMILNVKTLKPIPEKLEVLTGFAFNGFPDFPGVVSLSTYYWTFKQDDAFEVADNYTSAADPVEFARAILVTSTCSIIPD